MAESEKSKDKKKKIDRREFLVGSGAALAVGALAAGVPGAAEASSKKTSYPKSKAYLVWDSRLCLGCQSCMFACSMTHEGVANPSLSRIQIIRDAPSFTKYPYDVVMSVCRQCVTPLCVQNCPTGACFIDKENGNVRRIDQSKCIGCQRCIQACPHKPHRTIWDSVKGKSTKCDLCVDAPYWNEKGGPDGKQACVETCPVNALKLVKEAPSQTDISGYDVNLAPPPRKMSFPGMGFSKPAAKKGGE
jgi:protein NrfC